MPIGFIRGLSSVTDPASGGRIYTFENVKSNFTPEWATMSNIPSGISDGGAAVVNEKLYAISGMLSYVVLQHNLRYDSVNDTWSSLTDIPTGRAAFACSAVGNKIYCIAGSTYIDYVYYATAVNECYDITTDTWETLTQAPAAGGNVKSCVVNGYIYLFFSVQTHRYDPNTDTWSSRANNPYARNSGTAKAVGTKVYYIGGWDSVSPHNSTLCYDTITDTWQTLTPMSIGRGYLTGEAIGGYIYIIGGYKRVEGVSISLSLNERYDTLTDTWETQKDMPSVRGYVVSGVVNNEIYILGGTIKTRNERFSPFNDPDFSFEITHENEILFDQSVLIDSDFIAPNTRTKVDARDGMTLLFPETTSGTIALTGNVNIT